MLKVTKEKKKKKTNKKTKKQKKKKEEEEGITKIKHTGQIVESKNTRSIFPFKQSLKEDKLQLMYLFHQLKIREKNYGLNYRTPWKDYIQSH